MKPVLVHLGISGQRVDQADVRAFRRLDRADAAVMRRVHVAYFEAGTLAGQTARTQRREATLMCHLAQRIGLVHELAELAGPKEFAHGRGRRLGVDQVVRHDRVDIDGAHALADRPLHAQQADAVLVLHQLADGTNAAVAEIVDVVDLAAAVLQLDQGLHRAQQVILAQDADGVGHLVAGDAEPHVHLHAAHRGQVIAVRIKEQTAEQGFGGFRGGRLAGTHDAVDIDQRVIAVGVLIDRQRVANPRAVGLVDGERRQPGHAGIFQCGQLRLGEFLTGFGVDFAGFQVHQVLGDEAAEQVGAADQHFLGVLGDAASLAGGQLGFGIGNHLAGGGIDQRFQQLQAAERIRLERPRPALRRAVEHHLAVEVIEDLLRIHATDFAQFQAFTLRVARGAKRPGGRDSRARTATW